jgi:hypothetical protein
MKKASIAIFALTFLLFAKPTFAQYEGMSIPTESITPSPSPAPKMINYELPYPGILPGNPVYSLKAFRDKMVELLTTDPSRKTAFYLLQADKRLAASIILFDSGNPTLGEHTLSKSQNYLEKSIEEAKKAKQLKENVADTVAKIKASSQKQTDEIILILPKQNGETAEKLKEDLKRAEELQKSAAALD